MGLGGRSLLGLGLPLSPSSFLGLQLVWFRSLSHTSKGLEWFLCGVQEKTRLIDTFSVSAEFELLKLPSSRCVTTPPLHDPSRWTQLCEPLSIPPCPSVPRGAAFGHRDTWSSTSPMGSLGACPGGAQRHGLGSANASMSSSDGAELCSGAVLCKESVSWKEHVCMGWAFPASVVKGDGTCTSRLCCPLQK